jgi:hypothetical protein
MFGEKLPLVRENIEKSFRRKYYESFDVER